MVTKLEIDQWSTQLRKGLAELCVLAAVRRLQEAYGYQLVQFLAKHPGLEFTESTVYPLLARLAREGYLTATAKPSPSGPPRRYYRMTASGQQALTMMLDHLAQVDLSIHTIIDDDPNREK